MPKFERQWDHENSPLLWIEMVDRGDNYEMKRLVGFSFSGHYFISHNLVSTFYRNPQTAKTARDFGRKKYSDIRFIKKFYLQAKKAEKDLKIFSRSLATTDLKNKNNNDLIKIFKDFFTKNSILYAFYRFTRYDFYQGVTDDLKNKYDHLSGKKFSLLFSGKFKDKLISIRDQQLLSGLKMIGALRFSMHKIWISSYRKGNNLFKEIGRRTKLNPLQVQNCTSQEAINLLRGKKVNKTIINNRLSSFKFISQKNKFKIISPFKEKFIRPEFPEEIKGKTAYGGKVRGCVYLIPESLNNSARKIIAAIPKGSILVTVMTAPAMVPAMKKAAAFITDEGGLLCHAAIIARELKKPCIINTGRATKILKNGDRVEVDADKGIIKILNGQNL